MCIFCGVSWRASRLSMHGDALRFWAGELRLQYSLTRHSMFSPISLGQSENMPFTFSHAMFARCGKGEKGPKKGHCACTGARWHCGGASDEIKKCELT